MTSQSTWNKFTLLFLLILQMFSGGAIGSEFGDCAGTIRAELLVDGRKMKLLEDYVYTDQQLKAWLAPKGSVIDGASIPQAAWSFIGGPFEGRYRNASVTHDVECETKVNDWRSVHKMFYEHMMCSGVDIRKAKIMYAAVYQCGPRWGSDQGGRLFPCGEGIMRSFMRRWKSLIYNNQDIALSELDTLGRENLIARAKDPVEELTGAIGGLASITESDDSIRVSIPVDSGVVVNSRIKRVADHISTSFQDYPSVSIAIEGHTDNTGSAEMNLALSQRRVESARDRLIMGGIEQSAIETKSYGESEPVNVSDTEIARAQNRRVEFIIREEL